MGYDGKKIVNYLRAVLGVAEDAWNGVYHKDHRKCRAKDDCPLNPPLEYEFKVWGVNSCQEVIKTSASSLTKAIANARYRGANGIPRLQKDVNVCLMAVNGHRMEKNVIIGGNEPLNSDGIASCNRRIQAVFFGGGSDRPDVRSGGGQGEHTPVYAHNDARAGINREVSAQVQGKSHEPCNADTGNGRAVGRLVQQTFSFDQAKSYYLALCQDEDLPKNETLAEHRKHCDAEPGNCPFEKRADQTDKIETITPRKDTNYENYAQQRLPAKAYDGLRAGGPLLSAAIEICKCYQVDWQLDPKGSHRAIEDLSTIERNAGRHQERSIEAAARARGCWADDADVDGTQTYGPATEGGETIAFLDKQNGVAHKLITNTYVRQPIETFDRIALHNWLFPDTAMKVTGFGRTFSDWKADTENPMFVTMVDQPLVKIMRGATEGEIKEYMGRLGFAPWKGDWWSNDDESVLVGDLHSDNAVIDDQGKVRIIDSDIRLNFPRLGLGGTYELK